MTSSAMKTDTLTETLDPQEGQRSDLETNTYKSLNPFPILEEETGSLDGPVGKVPGGSRGSTSGQHQEQAFLPLFASALLRLKTGNTTWGNYFSFKTPPRVGMVAHSHNSHYSRAS